MIDLKLNEWYVINVPNSKSIEIKPKVFKEKGVMCVHFFSKKIEEIPYSVFEFNNYKRPEEIKKENIKAYISNYSSSSNIINPTRTTFSTFSEEELLNMPIERIKKIKFK